MLQHYNIFWYLSGYEEDRRSLSCSSEDHWCKLITFFSSSSTLKIYFFTLLSLCIVFNLLYSLEWTVLRRCLLEYRDDFLISYHVYVMTFHISLFEGTLHVNKIHVWFKIANITHALPVPVYRQTDFTPKRVVVSRLHDTVARFRTGVKFSPRWNNRDELTTGWLSPAWHFVVVSCKQM